jgi:HD-like signal output (HDOD) protein
LSLLNVDQLKPGMVLGRDLLDEDGRIILPQGSVLRQSHLGRLKAWGVRHAEVEGIRQEDLMRDSVSGIDPDVMNLSREKAAKFFYLFDLAHPVDAELFRVASLKIANELSEGRVMHHLNADLLEEYAPLWDPEIPEDEAPRLSRILGDEIELSSFPDIYFKIIEVLDSPLSSAGQAADVVGQDTSLSAKLLKLVNSAYFGFMSKIDSIQRAITLVGHHELSTLALGISVIHYFKDIPRELIDMGAFWRHSIACGTFARILAGLKGMGSEEPYFVAGLLHDIGRLILFMKAPRATTKAMVQAFQVPTSLAEAERDVLGYDHAAVGGLLLQEWRFPSHLVEMVRLHHGPDKAPGSLGPAIIHLADVLAVAYGIGQISMELVPKIDSSAWETVGLSPDVFATVFSEAERQINDINTILLDQVA